MKKQLLFGVFIFCLFASDMANAQNVITAPLRVEASTTTGGYVDFMFKRSQLDKVFYDRYEITINGVTVVQAPLGSGKFFNTTLQPNDTLRIYSSCLEDVEIKPYPYNDEVIDHLELFGLDSCLKRLILINQPIRYLDISPYTILEQFNYGCSDSLQEVRMGPNNVSIWRFTLCGNYNVPFDTRYLSGVEEAYLWGLEVDSVDFSNMHHVRVLCPTLTLKRFDMTGMDSLRNLYNAFMEELDTLVFPDNDVLEYFRLSSKKDNYQMGLDLSRYVHLEYFDLNVTPWTITSLHLGQLPKLKKIGIWNQRHIRYVDLTGCPALEEIIISNAALEEIVVPTLDSLKEMIISGNELLVSDIPPRQSGVVYALNPQRTNRIQMDNGVVDLRSELYAADTLGTMHRTRFQVQVVNSQPLVEGVDYREEDGMFYFDKELDGYTAFGQVLPKPYLLQIVMNNDAIRDDLNQWVQDIVADSILFDKVYVANSLEAVTAPEALFYPNPAKDQLQFAQSEVDKGYRIIDMAGQTIMSGVITGSMSVSALPSGSYMLGIAYQDRYRWHKLVKE